jgi:hypothetical protein
MLTLATAFLVCLGFVLHLMASAPEGYEDEGGFHYGRRDGRS